MMSCKLKTYNFKFYKIYANCKCNLFFSLMEGISFVGKKYKGNYHFDSEAVLYVQTRNEVPITFLDKFTSDMISYYGKVTKYADATIDASFTRRIATHIRMHSITANETMYPILQGPTKTIDFLEGLCIIGGKKFIAIEN